MTNYTQVMDDILELSSDIIGKTKEVIINTGIYGHSVTYRGDHKLSIDKDTFIIKGSVENPISLNNIKELINYMKQQFTNLDKGGYNLDRYEYKRLCFDTDWQQYYVYWSS